ncbi:MAG: NAD(P)-binding domain-containing protein [Acidobacteriota bacterium]
MNCYDLIIIGAGPAGLSAAYAAARHSLNYLVLERGRIADTVHNYPLGKPLFSTPNELEFEPGALKPVNAKPTREELLDYYYRFVAQAQLRIHTDEPVEAITAGEPFLVQTRQARYQARAVLVAVGGMGRLNRLEVPGETSERVSYLFHNAGSYRGQQVLVVGGGNSAAEAALYLTEEDVEVTLALRRPSLDREPNSINAGIKPWVRHPLEMAIASGRIQALFSARVISILPQSACLAVADRNVEIACDHILALLGARPDVSLLATAGVAIADDGRPIYDRQTYETGVANLFVAGHLTRELHMKHAIGIPPHIVAFIATRLTTQTAC